MERWRCQYCPAMFAVPLDERTAVAEHMTPIARGGSDDISNIEVSCRRCNSKKHTKTVREYVATGPAIFHPDYAHALEEIRLGAA